MSMYYFDDVSVNRVIEIVYKRQRERRETENERCNGKEGLREKENREKEKKGRNFCLLRDRGSITSLLK